MYSIEKKPWGYYLTFSDIIHKEEMEKWVGESKKALLNHPKEFGVFVDMRKLKPLDEETQKVMVTGQQLYKSAGMSKSAVVLESVSVSLQFKRLAKESGIYQWERYIAAASNTNWEQTGIDWITKGIDPDK
jgi:hypothetical protein